MWGRESRHEDKPWGEYSEVCVGIGHLHAVAVYSKQSVVIQRADRRSGLGADMRLVGFLRRRVW